MGWAGKRLVVKIHELQSYPSQKQSLGPEFSTRGAMLLFFKWYLILCRAFFGCCLDGCGRR